MKLEQLRKVIREEVKTAMREELQEILNEAVRVASKPTGKKITYKQPSSKNQNSITEMLNQTKESMTSQEYRNVYTGTSDMVSKPNFASSMANSMGIGNNQPGIDITKLNFVKKAGEVYNKAIEKDKQKYGVV
jgi:hypothetical protein|tara:strand:- start:161 stop:559 length:399 start_codon:yes stop_codon:yes gene_type:complete